MAPALNARREAKRWKYKVGHFLVASKKLVVEGSLFAGVGREARSSDVADVALDYALVALVWSQVTLASRAAIASSELLHLEVNLPRPRIPRCPLESCISAPLFHDLTGDSLSPKYIFRHLIRRLSSSLPLAS